MKQRTTGLIAALSLSALAITSAPAALALPRGPVPTAKAARYIVTTDNSSVTEDAAVDVRRAGGRVRNVYTRVLTGFSATLTPDQAQQLKEDPRVQSVVADKVFHSTTTQTNPTWGLDRIDQRSATRNGSYRYDKTGAGVTAFVVDTGMRLGHAQFGGRARSGYDFVGNDSTASDCDGHGTHVAGTIGGSTYGAAKGVKYVAVRVLDCDGAGYASDIIDAMDWIVGHKPSGPAVVNMSIGGGSYNPLDQAVERTVAAGIPVVVAAGNEGVDACTVSPARAPHAITVAATDSRDTRPEWSNYGRCVDVFAPGVNVRSASRASSTANEVMSGTSMAAPHVTGAIARHLQLHPKDTPGQVTAALLAVSTAGVVKEPAGSPNRLLYAAAIDVATSPTSATKVVATSSGTAKTATLTWAAPSHHGGESITGYRVSRNGEDINGVGSKTVVLPASARSHTFTALRPGSWYTLSIRPVNAVGYGPVVSKSTQLSW